MEMAIYRTANVGPVVFDLGPLMWVDSARWRDRAIWIVRDVVSDVLNKLANDGAAVRLVSQARPLL
jgi:hypothetical protein